MDTDIPGISQEYLKQNAESIQILKLIFSPYKAEDIPKIKSFLHLYTEIFNYSEKHNLPEEKFEDFDSDSKLLKRCIQKHREVFRQCFRGAQYLSTTKFREVANNALSTATSCLLSEDMSNMESIKSRIKLEQKWLEVVNEQRTKDLKMYKTELIEIFMATLEQKFPLLYDPKSLAYIESQVLYRKLNRLLTASKKQFISKLPFHDQQTESLVNQAVFQFQRSLEDLAMDLISRNLERRKVADACTSEIVVECLKEYRNNMETFILKDYKTYLLDVQIIQQEHKKLIEDKVSTLLTRDPLNRVRKIREAVLEQYLIEAQDVLKIILNKWNEKIKIKLKSNEKAGKLGMQDGLENISKIFGEIGMCDIADGFKSHVEETLAAMFQHVQDTNKAAITKLEILTKLWFEQTGKYNMDFKRNFQSWKMLYMKKIVYESQGISKIKGNDEVIQAVEKARIYILEIIDQHHTGLDKEDIEEVEDFMEELKEELLNNRELLLEIIRRYNDSAVKFKETYGHDMMMKNGALVQIRTRFQYIDSTEQFDISFEELRLNEEKRHNQVFRAALKMALPESLFAFCLETTPAGDIVAAFDKCLKFTDNYN